MKGFIFDILLKVSQLGVSAAIKATDKLTGSVGRTESATERAGQQFKKTGRKATNAWDDAKRSIKGYLTTAALVAATMSALNASTEIDALSRAIDFASAGKGAENIEFLNSTIKRLKLPIQETFEGYKQLAGGLIGSGIESETNKIFNSVATASRVMQLSGEQTQGALLAISQIASKGKVSAEELRGQLGERLPGAFAIAARSIGVTTSALDKMLEQGQLTAKDFLPAFATELEKTFGPGVDSALESGRAKFTEMQNSIFQLKQEIGDKLMPVAIDMINNYLIPAVSWMSANLELLKHTAVAVGIAAIAVKFYSGWVAIAAFATGGWKASFAALNVAMRANPIGIVITALGALTAGVVYAWNNFEGFRGFLFGMFAAMKEMGSILFDFLIKPLMSLGEIVLGVFTFDADRITSGLKNAASLFQKETFNVGKRLAVAFDGGFQKGVADFRLDGVADKLAAQQEKKFGKTGEASNAVSSAFSGLDSKTKTKESAANSSKLIKGNQSIVGGGKQQKNITINIEKLVEELKIVAQDVTQGADEMVEIIQRKLLQSINAANLAQ